MILDINGQEIEKGNLANLLCEVLEIEPDSVRIRVMNSEAELSVGTYEDEVLGGVIADSELTAFNPAAPDFQQCGLVSASEWAEHD